MKKNLFNISFLMLFVSSGIGFSQSSNDQIIPNQLNEKFLEHLVKTKIDSIRLLNDCKPLVNDSILFVAAEHHSAYMLKKNQLTHFEEDQPTYKTPQLRAVAYGAIDYLVGENALKTNANSTITSKKGKVFDTNTYNGLANNIVDAWVNSPGHFKNIITPDYQITGVSIAYENGKIYACQKFARVLYKYQFEESKSFFPYSTYEQESVVSSFSGIPTTLIPYKYEWGLKQDKLEKCQVCLDLEEDKPFITLRYEAGNFILRVENAAYVEALIQDANDGFAVEIVEYNDYVCGNPAYYSKPSRRNGQLKTNGRLLKPLFKQDLIKGFKKRRKKKDVSYLSYIFGADSVKFINRFSQYKMAQYESEYYEINLGKLPKDVDGLWAHNLAYIQRNQICRFDYFTNYCGEVFSDSIPFHFLPLDTNVATYTFKSEAQSLFFEIPFEQNKAEFTKADIEPFIKSLSNTSYFIDSVNIRAFSSVEGDSTANNQLQLRRAKSILAVLQKNQREAIPSKIETATAWDDFYSQLRRNIKYRSLVQKSKAEIIEELKNDKVLADLEPFLAEERRAEIQLYVRVDVNNQNCESFAKKELARIESVLKNPSTDENTYAKELLNFEKLYAYVHRQAVAGFIHPSYLATINLPAFSEKRSTLMEKFLLYGHEFEADFQNNAFWKANQAVILSTLVEKAYEHMTPIFKYDNAYFNTRILLSKKSNSQAEIQRVINELKRLEKFYFSHPKAKNEIENINANLNLLLLNTTFTTNPSEAASDAELAIDQLYFFYAERNLLDTTKVLQLAKTAVFYMNIPQAQLLTAPFLDNAEILKYVIPLGYQNPDDPLAAPFYEMLIELAKTRSAEDWCPLFMNECQIPFQALDYEKLRDVYCEKCGVWKPDLEREF